MGTRSTALKPATLCQIAVGLYAGLLFTVLNLFVPTNKRSREKALPVKRLKEDFSDALQNGALSLNEVLAAEWMFADLAAAEGQQILDCFVDIIFRWRTNVNGTHRDLFEHDINKLVYLKRLLFEREIILT